MEIPVIRIPFQEFIDKHHELGDKIIYIEVPSKDVPDAFFSGVLDTYKKEIYCGWTGIIDPKLGEPKEYYSYRRKTQRD